MKVQTRHAYSKSDEDRMQHYVRNHRGSTASLKFWREASAALKLPHSADSLRCHWRLLERSRLGS